MRSPQSRLLRKTRNERHVPDLFILPGRDVDRGPAHTRGVQLSCLIGLILGFILLAAFILGAIATAGFGCASTSSVGLNVLPFPDTPDASPQSLVIFPVSSPSDLTAVNVQGSRSGRHSGQLSALPDGGGTAFVPDAPFTPGERVTVRATLGSSTAAAAMGSSGGTKVSFNFTVATFSTAPTTPINQASGTSSQAAPPPLQSFHSRPDLQPPVVTVSTPVATASEDCLFVDAQFAPQNGPMILDTNGDLVWFHPLSDNTMALDVRVQTYEGEPVLTWWQGTVVSPGYGRGEGVIVDRSYRTIATVHAGEGYEADLHEFLLTSRGTALITADQPVKADLSSIGGPKDGILLDSIIQEIDVKTGRVLWEWHALGHVPLTASYSGKPTAGSPYDFFHVNSIDEAPDGNLIVSARNTWAVYKVSRSTGAIIWQLGGKGGNFLLGPGAQFEYQHDARLQPDGTLTVFDNAAQPKQEDESRALHLKLDMEAMSATLLASYKHTPSLLTGSQGDVQILPNGNVFVGWGDQAYFSEFTAAGVMVFDASLPAPVQTYRAFRSVWSGEPSEPPSLSVSRTGSGGLTVYASWNGATDVARWQLLGGSAPGDLGPVATAPATGFETALSALVPPAYIAVRALDSTGSVLGTSATISP